MILYFILMSAVLYVAHLSTRKNRWFAPGRFLVFVLLVHGLLLKPLIVAFEVPSKEIVESLIINPINSDYYWEKSWLIIIFYLIFAVSMLVGAVLFSGKKTVSRVNSNTIRFEISLIWIFYFIGLAAVIQFLVLNPELIATGSKNSLATDDITEYFGFGALRLMELICFMLPFVLIQNIASHYKVKQSWRLAIISSTTHIIFLYLSDQRGGLLFSVLSWAISYNLLIAPIKRKLFLYAMVFALALGLFKTFNRLSADNVVDIQATSEVVANIAGKNFVEISKTISTFDAVDLKIGYMLGGTYLDALSIFIPRTFYPTKTTVNLDTIVGREVYGCEAVGACGVPPGLLAESYLNFGYVWVLISTIIIGFMVGVIDKLALSRSSTIRNIYAINLVYFGVSIMGSSVASYLTQTIFHLVVFGAIYIICRKPTMNLASNKFSIALK